MPTKRLTVSGLSLNVFDEGAGEAVLLLHGFPDSHLVWRRQIPELLKAGYRVIAPDLRGFGQSDKPQAKEAYAIAGLIADVVAILDASDVEAAHIVAHDWGATLAWCVAALLPQRVKSLVALSVGHPELFYASSVTQREKSWYMLLFQLPNAEQLLADDDWQLFREWNRNHAETDAWIEALSAPGALTAALNWYRANIDPAVKTSGIPKVSARTMGIWSSGDHYLTEQLMVDSKRFVEGPWRYERVEDASHWLQLDRPQLVNGLILEFLRGG